MHLKLILPIAIVLLCVISCKDNTQKKSVPGERIRLDSYKLFEEPSIDQLGNLQFYFLAASWGGINNTYILSIRKDSSNSYGYYKVIDKDLMPPISNAIKTDTFPFIYSTTYFKLKSSDIDTLEKLLQDYRINTLKDSLLTKSFDGGTNEIIVYNKGRSFNVFRSGHESSIEKNYTDFLRVIRAKFTPPDPIPSFRRVE